MSKETEKEVELPERTEFSKGDTVTVNGGTHPVTGIGTEDGMNVVELGDRGDHPFLRLVWPFGSNRGLLQRVPDGKVESEHPVEQFAWGEVDTDDHPTAQF